MSNERVLAGMRRMLEIQQQQLADRQVFPVDNESIDAGDFRRQDFDKNRLRNQVRPNAGWGKHTLELEHKTLCFVILSDRRESKNLIPLKLLGLV